MRRWQAGYPLELARQLADLRRGNADPTHAWISRGPAWQHGWWRTSLTPLGPATLHLSALGAQEVHAQAWGPGGPWVLEQLPRLLGQADQPQGWRPHHRAVELAARHWGQLRLGRTDLLLGVVIPAVLEQRVTGLQAWQAWRSLLRQYGTPAPGPAGLPRDCGGLGMCVVPSVSTWRMIPSWRWHQAGVDSARSATLLRVLRLPLWHQHLDPVQHEARWRQALARVPGVGV